MKRKLNIIKGPLLLSGSCLLLAILLSSWGYTGHQKIAVKSELWFETKLQDFISWLPYIADHSADPDVRKSWDNSESPKHFIDIDAYPEYIRTGKIPHDIDTLVLKYTRSFVLEQGILPWATIATYDSLVSCFKRYDFDKAKYFAADLSHYVADGFMPLHITSNYNGQFTGNTGIHSRYESDMIGKYVHNLDYNGGSVNKIPNITDYIFNYLYASYQFKDSILNADNYAKTINTNTKSAEYIAALWAKTETITLNLFEGASFAFSELFYNAWLDAGSPDINNTALIQTSLYNHMKINLVHWDSISRSITIAVNLKNLCLLDFEIKDITGKSMHKSTSDNTKIGEQHFVIDNCNFVAGPYFLVVKSDKQTVVEKLMVY